MAVKHDDLNASVVLFLGFGRFDAPRNDSAAVLGKYNANDAGEIMSEILDMLKILEDIEIDWRVSSIDQARSHVRDIMKSERPYLDDRALDAFEWKFAYDWL